MERASTCPTARGLCQQPRENPDPAPFDLKFSNVDSHPRKLITDVLKTGFQLRNPGLNAKPSADDMRTRRACARACRQQLEETQQRKRLPLEDFKSKKKREDQNAGKFRKCRKVGRSCTESSALHANYHSRGGSVDSEPVVKSAFV